MKDTNPLAPYALTIPNLLIPDTNIDLSRWSVIACDQFTQDREYWAKLKKEVGDQPSILNIILPEVYLEDSDRAERLANIRSAMNDYLNPQRSGGPVFRSESRGMVYIERITAYGRCRKGLIACVDLDGYDWKPDSRAPVRATEATIVDRIPPRMEIRRGAPIESPHIMLLVNDPGKTLVEEAGKAAQKKEILYSTTLRPQSGSITGWLIDSDQEIRNIGQALEAIKQANTDTDGSSFIFAVGDGNHSLATAKAVWDEYRQNCERTGMTIDPNHPARFALVEIVNLYDEGLTFEPIHRVLFGTDTATLSTWLTAKMGGTLKSIENAHKLEEAVAEQGHTRFGFISPEGMTILDTPGTTLAVSRLQPLLDEFLSTHPGTSIDYIHGTEEALRLGTKAGTVSMLLPPVEKDSFFTTIASGGPLPRKSFSMGEASEKRFYLECRRLFN